MLCGLSVLASAAIAGDAMIESDGGQRVVRHGPFDGMLMEQRLTVHFNDTDIRTIVNRIDSVFVEDFDVRWENILPPPHLIVDPARSIHCDDCALAEVLSMVAEACSTSQFPVSWCVRDGTVVIDETQVIRRELIVLRTYDVHDLTTRIMRRDQHRDLSSAANSLMRAIRDAVHEYEWTDMGGELASDSHVNGQWIVRAPLWIHREIEWLLEHLDAPPSATMPIWAGSLLVDSDRVPQSPTDVEKLRRDLDALQRTHDLLLAELAVHQATIQSFERRMALLGTVGE